MRRPSALPALLIGVTVFAAAAEVVTLVRFTGWGGAAWEVAAENLSDVAFVAVGALILARRRRHVVGWLCAVAGTCFALEGAASTYAELHFAAGGDSWLGVWSGWASLWLWIPAFTAAYIVLPVLFPDGRVPSRRWRPYLAFVVVAPALQLFGALFTPGPMRPDDVALWPNPIGVPALEPFATAMDTVMEVAFFGVLALIVGAVVVRFRRGRADERQQLKWFLFAVVLVTSTFVFSTTPLFDRLPTAIVSLGFLLLPVSIGIAVLRYRLYEIDRVISRTLSYALVTGVLVGLYAGGVFVLSPVVASVGGGSQLAVAGSTLAVAAAFGPLRRRVQGGVDRRFNRARYDAQREVAAFAARLRDEVGLDHLAEEVLATVHRTVAPAGATLWLRAGSPS